MGRNTANNTASVFFQQPDEALHHTTFPSRPSTCSPSATNNRTSPTAKRVVSWTLAPSNETSTTRGNDQPALQPRFSSRALATYFYIQSIQPVTTIRPCTHTQIRPAGELGRPDNKQHHHVLYADLKRNAKARPSALKKWKHFRQASRDFTFSKRYQFPSPPFPSLPCLLRQREDV